MARLTAGLNAVPYSLVQKKSGTNTSATVRDLTPDTWLRLSTETISRTGEPMGLQIAGTGVLAIRATLVDLKEVGEAQDNFEVRMGVGPVGAVAPDEDSVVSASVEIRLGRGATYLAQRCTFSPIASLSLTYISSSATNLVTQSEIVAPTCAADDSPLDAPYRLAFSPTAGSQDVHTLTATAAALGLNYTLSVPGRSMVSYGNGTRDTNSRITLTVPGGQSGACATGRCSQTMTHTLYVIY